MNGRADFREPNAEVARPIPHIGADYIPTEEERRVFAECNDESFWFRCHDDMMLTRDSAPGFFIGGRLRRPPWPSRYQNSRLTEGKQVFRTNYFLYNQFRHGAIYHSAVPLAATSMLITQGLISKGFLSSHPKYGSIPKLIFACIMGYFAGKLSYVKTCQEKFKHLENSPLGEALRSGQARRASIPGYYSQKPRYESNVSDHSSFVTAPAADNMEKEKFPRYEPIPFSSSMNESTPTGITDHIAQGPDSRLEESPKRKSITYEELRNKNRESYEVTLAHKTDPSVRPMQERIPQKEVKVNKYGDAWEE